MTAAAAAPAEAGSIGAAPCDPFPLLGDPLHPLLLLSSCSVCCCCCCCCPPADLTKEHPELMISALMTHNHLIRKAQGANFGYTIEQEGDSFSIVFREASDAVKFCLQVGG